MGTIPTMRRRLRWGLGLLVVLSCTPPLAAAPIGVRLREGTVRGFLAIRSADGERIGHGELTQRPRGDVIEGHLRLQFHDGSIHDELTTFSQRGVFRLEAYRLMQRGPSFPGT